MSCPLYCGVNYVRIRADQKLLAREGSRYTEKTGNENFTSAQKCLISLLTIN